MWTSDFPISGWQGTFLLDDQSGIRYTVYTNANFRDGKLGFVLDDYGEPNRNFPVIEFKKPKITYHISGDPPFFHWVALNRDTFALRYGGKKEGTFIFDLYKTKDAQVDEIIQTIEVTEEDLLEGIYIKRVLVKGYEGNEKGILHYTIDSVVERIPFYPGIR